MRVKIKRVDTTLPLPNYQTPGAAAFDIHSRINTTVPPHTVARIPTNLIVEVPRGYLLAVVPRSSTPVKKGLSTPHGFGIIDHDYCGPDDEILFQVYNFTDTDVRVQRGERIGQAAFLRVDQMTWKEVAEMKNKTRGGFGSTG